MVELTPTMVRDVDTIDAEFDRLAGILDRGDALQDQRDVEFRPEALDIAPVEPRLKHPGIAADDGACPAAASMALGDVALAPAIPIGVDRDAERVIAGIDRAAELVIDPTGISQHIELKDLEAAARRRGGRFEAGV